MRHSRTTARALLLGASGGSAMLALTGGAWAGGFDVHEQSTYFQGMSFAGAAAGGHLSSMFWNPAAAGDVGNGITMDSSYTLIIPRAEIDAKTIDLSTGTADASVLGLDTKVDVGRDAVVPASYAAYRVNEQLVLAVGMNSQFGLGTKPDNTDWVGSGWARSAKLFSTNVTPTVAYQLSNAITVAAGLQVQYIDLTRFKTNSAGVGPGPSSVLEGDDFGFGFTAGVELKPAAGTTIGVGFRSSISHELEGSVDVVGAPPGVLTAPIHADLDLPEKVTASFRQELASNFRLLGTVEWTNWSRLDVIPVESDGPLVVPAGVSGAAPFGAVLPKGTTVANLDFEWEDGWYFALGGEYDVNDKLTLRAGGAYEISPIQKAASRLIQLPDADRIWASIGGSYRYSETTTINFAYSHVFVEDSEFDRVPASTLAAASHLTGDVEAAVDILSVGMTTKW